MRIFHWHHKKRVRNASRGFSLVELLAVLAVLAIITAVVLSGSARGRSGLFLTNSAYELALFVREAQAYGVSARKEVISTADSAPYGVFLDRNVGNSATLFTDLSNPLNNIYDSGGGELVQTLTLTGGSTVFRFCGTPVGGGAEQCSDAGGPNTLHIAFKRPNPDAIITGLPGPVSYESATVTLMSPYGEQRTIQILVTGQIAVLNN